MALNQVGICHVGICFFFTQRQGHAIVRYVSVLRRSGWERALKRRETALNQVGPLAIAVFSSRTGRNCAGERESKLVKVWAKSEMDMMSSRGRRHRSLPPNSVRPRYCMSALIFEYLDAGRSQALENLFQFSDLLYLAATLSTGLTGHAVSNDGSTMSGPLTAVLATIPPGSMSTKVDLLKHLEENGEIVDALAQYAATYTARATDALTAATGGPAAPSVAPPSCQESSRNEDSTEEGGHSSRGGSPQAGACREGQTGHSRIVRGSPLGTALHDAGWAISLVRDRQGISRPEPVHLGVGSLYAVHFAPFCVYDERPGGCCGEGIGCIGSATASRGDRRAGRCHR